MGCIGPWDGSRRHPCGRFSPTCALVLLVQAHSDRFPGYNIDLAIISSFCLVAVGTLLWLKKYQTNFQTSASLNIFQSYNCDYTYIPPEFQNIFPALRSSMLVFTEACSHFTEM